MIITSTSGTLCTFRGEGVLRQREDRHVSSGQHFYLTDHQTVFLLVEIEFLSKLRSYMEKEGIELLLKWVLAVERRVCFARAVCAPIQSILPSSWTGHKYSHNFKVSSLHS